MGEVRSDAGKVPSLSFSGLLGLVSNVVFFVAVSLFRACCVPIVLRGWAVPVAFLFCLALSVAEIPMMVFALRKLADGRRGTPHFALAMTNVFYVFFASVYAGIFVLLTGQVVSGGALSALGIVRFFSSLFFVRLHPEEIQI